MGAPKRYPPPHKQLGELMIEARRQAMTFDAFWMRAVRPEKGQRIVMVTDEDPPPGCVLWPTDPKDRREWRHAITTTKEGWRRAYYREPPSKPEDAVRYLGDALSELEGLATDDELAVA